MARSHLNEKVAVLCWFIFYLVGKKMADLLDPYAILVVALDF